MSAGRAHLAHRCREERRAGGGSGAGHSGRAHPSDVRPEWPASAGPQRGRLSSAGRSVGQRRTSGIPALWWGLSPVRVRMPSRVSG